MAGITYWPIKGNEIRLILLHPGEYGTPIQLQIWGGEVKPKLNLGHEIPGSDIKHAEEGNLGSGPPLVESSPYEALSYIWGTQTATSKVVVGSFAKSVAVNVHSQLEAALQQLRYPKNFRTLYLDFLSIDQKDSNEKDRQVQMFAEIFHNAVNVCIWLGSSADDSDLAMDFIPQILDLFRFEDLVVDPAYSRQWLALTKLIGRPWFQRRWIVQEMALARRATVHCGSKQCSWTDFTDALALFQSRWLDLSTKLAIEAPLEIGEVQAPGATSLVNISANIFRKNSDGDILEYRYDLETLLAILPMFAITHPSDAIYSVLALARPYPEAVKKFTTHDYSRPSRDVFHDAVSYIVSSTGSLDIVCRPWAPTLEYGQSYVCEMSKFAFVRRQDGQYDRQNADSLVGLPGRGSYHASKGRIWHQGHADFSDPRGIFASYLSTGGIHVDKIEVDGGPSYDANIPEKWQHLGGWHNRAKDPVPEAFWRTLVVDRNAEGDNPPTWYRKACESSFRLLSTSNISTTKLLTICRKHAHLVEFLRRVQASIWNRRMFRTKENNYIGVGPEALEPGDWICVLNGCSVPVVLRELRFGHFTLIGECFVYGLMEGQAVDDPKASTERSFQLR